MKRAAIYSALLHVAILVVLLVGFYNPFHRTIPINQPMIIDFVSIAETSAAPEISPIQHTEPEAKQEPTPEPKSTSEPTPPAEASPPPPLEQPTPAPQPPAPKPQAEPIPDPLLKKKEELPQKIEPQKKPDVKPEKKTEKKDEPTKETLDLTLEEKKKALEKKTKDEKKKKKKVEDDFSQLLDDIKKDDKGKKEKSSPSPKGRGAPADRIGATLTASEIDAIRQRVRRCWLVPAGTRGIKNMVVDIEMSLAPDGTVTTAKIVDRARLSDPFYRDAAESAHRAVLDPRCNPLPIPREKYEKYKTLTLAFDPKDM